MLLQFQNVSKEFEKGILAVNDISFTIDESEFVFLIGPSGSGKTTLIQMMIRDVMPSEGKIYLHDTDITRISRRNVYKLRRQIGVVFQDYKLIPHKTAAENVQFAMEAAGRHKHEIRETVPYVLEVVGLTGRMHAFPEELSGGEQQRVAIARAIANNPSLLIADEPTGNLDPASAWDIIQILQKINNWGTTVIMSTHGTEIVNSLSKRVIQMHDGQVIRDDSEGGYEFSETVEKRKSGNSKKSGKSKNKKAIKVNLNDHLDSLSEDSGMPEPSEISSKGVAKKKGFFSRLFGRDKQEIQEEISSEGIDEVLEEEDKRVIRDFDLSQSTEDMSADEELVKKPKAQKTEKKKNNSKKTTKKSKNTKKKKKAKNEDTELEEVFDAIKNDSVEVLSISAKMKDKLLDNGFRTLGEVVEIGPETLQSRVGLSDKQISDISSSILEYVEDN